MKAVKSRSRPLIRAVECCPTCKRAFVPPGLELSPIRKRIIALLERHGEIMPEVLHAAIWGSDPNGGPTMTNLHTIVHQLNKQLSPYGLAVRSGRGKLSPYRLVAEAAE